MAYARLVQLRRIGNDTRPRLFLMTGESTIQRMTKEVNLYAWNQNLPQDCIKILGHRLHALIVTSDIIEIVMNE